MASMASRRLLRPVAVLVCLAVAAMPPSWAHLHLCFDGGEPPSSMHMAHDAPHHDDDTSSHRDVDVKVAGDALVKKATPAGLHMFMAPNTVLFEASQPPSAAFRDRTSPVLPGQAYWPLPPSRAPPA